MVFNIPDSRQETIDRTKTEVQNALPTSNPFLPSGLIGILTTAFGGQIYDFYLQLKQLRKAAFVQTAFGIYLDYKASLKGITINAATQARGNITATGTPGSNIPVSTLLQDSVGNQYTTDNSAIISSVSLSVSSMVRSGNTVTVTTVSNHSYGSGMTITHSGADQAEYNIAAVITVTGLNTYIFTIETTPVSPATGTILAAANTASIAVTSVDFGQNQNQTSGAQLTFSSPIAGVDNITYVQFTEIAGGTDLESEESYRQRTIERYQNPIAHYNVNDIRNEARKVSGVTRVFIFESGVEFGNATSVSSITRTGNVVNVEFSSDHNLEDCMFLTILGADQDDYNGVHRILVIDNLNVIYVISGTPVSPATGVITSIGSVALGQTAVYFTRDNDLSIIPTAQEVQDVKDQLSLIRPANTSDLDLIVKGPTPLPVNFTFTALTPNTQTMQEAITANLDAFFRGETTIGEDLSNNSYESVIYNTVDPETNTKVQGFTLSAPSGTVTVQFDEIPTLGTIIYP